MTQKLLSHPYDTMAVIKTLCEAHADLRRLRFSSGGYKASVSPIPEGSPTLQTLALLEDEIVRLTRLVPGGYRNELRMPLARTHIGELCALLPEPAPEEFFIVNGSDVIFAIGNGVDALRMELDMGMVPSFSTFDVVWLFLMRLCEPEAAEAWRCETKRLIQRIPEALFTTVLAYVRERQSEDGGLPETLSVFLAEIIREGVHSHPDEAATACRGATIGSSTHDVAAMIIAGVSPKVDRDAFRQGGPKVCALLEACSSSHGHLDLIRRYGPLERYFRRGEVPNYRTA